MADDHPPEVYEPVTWPALNADQSAYMAGRLLARCWWHLQQWLAFRVESLVPRTDADAQAADVRAPAPHSIRQRAIKTFTDAIRFEAGHHLQKTRRCFRALDTLVAGMGVQNPTSMRHELKVSERAVEQIDFDLLMRPETSECDPASLRLWANDEELDWRRDELWSCLLPQSISVPYFALEKCIIRNLSGGKERLCGLGLQVEQLLCRPDVFDFTNRPYSSSVAPMTEEQLEQLNSLRSTVSLSSFVIAVVSFEPGAIKLQSNWRDAISLALLQLNLTPLQAKEILDLNNGYSEVLTGHDNSTPQPMLRRSSIPRLRTKIAVIHQAVSRLLAPSIGLPPYGSSRDAPQTYFAHEVSPCSAPTDIERIPQEIVLGNWGLRLEKYSKSDARLYRADKHVEFKGSVSIEFVHKLAKHKGSVVPFDVLDDNSRGREVTDDPNGPIYSLKRRVQKKICALGLQIKMVRNVGYALKPNSDLR